LNDRFANVNGGSKRGYWLKDNNAKFNNLQIQNAALASSNTVSFGPFIGANDAADSVQILNVYNAGNQVPSNKGTAPPTASDFTVTVARPSNGQIAVTSATFFSHASTNNRLLAVWGGVGGVVDISLAHDVATFTIADNTKTSYTFSYAVGNKYGAGTAKCTIQISGTAGTPRPATATPRPATTKPATPKPATSSAATPKPATTKPATPKPATAKPATPKPATSSPSGTYPPSSAADHISAGSGLNSDSSPNYLQSNDKRFRFTVTTDGNLLVQQNGVTLWSIGAHPNAGPYRLNMQTDGNLVLYNGSWSPIWATGTGGSGNQLNLQPDGNLVMYSNTGSPLWASNTGGH